jgi:hypothetical protein
MSSSSGLAALIRSSFAPTLPSERAQCTSKSRSRPEGIDAAAHRRPEASPSARHSGPAAHEEHSHSLLRQLECGPISYLPRERSRYTINHQKCNDLLVICVSRHGVPSVGPVGLSRISVYCQSLLELCPLNAGAERGEVRFNNLILTNVAVSSWLSTFGLQGA